MRQFSAALAVCLLHVSGQAQSGEKCPANWQKLVVGAYQGQAGAGRPEQRSGVTTVFKLGEDGRLGATYVLHEPKGDSAGIATLVTIQPCRAQFRWRDHYGVGRAIFDFVPGQGTFSGVYGGAGDSVVDSGLVWNGRR